MNEITRDALLAVLSLHIGERRGIHIQALVAELLGTWGRGYNPADGRKVRELVAELRRAGHHVCAHPASGYFLAENAAELDRTCLFLYDRAISSLEQIAAMKRVSMPDLRGQLRLPT